MLKIIIKYTVFSKIKHLCYLRKIKHLSSFDDLEFNKNNDSLGFLKK